MKLSSYSFVFSLVLFFILSSQLSSQWSTNPMVNNPICKATNGQWHPLLVTDGSGGAIIVWIDYRGIGSSIYAQKINSNGVIQWKVDGIPICISDDLLSSTTIVSDGLGGAIIAWEDRRTHGLGDIYAQKINGYGVVQWTANGVAISIETNLQTSPTIVSDDSGGAIIAWMDRRSEATTGLDIYTQKINSSGSVKWTTNGVVISTAAAEQSSPKIVSDDSGGAIITWADYRSGQDIYAQKINSSGVVKWTADGVAICKGKQSQVNPTIVSDDSGGAIITWSDPRNNVDFNIYSQKINSSGVVKWVTNGVPICTATGNQYDPTIVSDGSGGAIITWRGPVVQAQKINSSGVVQWITNGITISVSNSDHNYPSIVIDGSGGAIITLYNANNLSINDIYAQRINSTGVVQWTANGVAVSTADSYQLNPAIVSDSLGGAIITWGDSRNGDANSDIYAQRVRADGSLGGTTAVDNNQSAPIEFSLQQNYPNPFNPITIIKYSIDSPNKFGIGKQFVSLVVYDVLGNEIATLVKEDKFPGNYGVNFDAKGLSSGVYFYRLQAGKFVRSQKMVLIK